MDFPQETKDRIDNRSSTIDRTKSFNYRSSMIDAYTNKFQHQFNDPTLGSLFVGKALNRLGEQQVNNIAEYALREARTSAGHLFVRICSKVMNSQAQ